MKTTQAERIKWKEHFGTKESAITLLVDDLEELSPAYETLKETAEANERYIFAIPALCRGENVACAMHVSQPITTLRTQLAAKEREIAERDAVIRELVEEGDYLVKFAQTSSGREGWDEMRTKALALQAHH